jgi:hypothetical protein
MPDPLPSLINEHTWSTIKNTPGSTHRLVSLGGQAGGELLDWIEETHHYDVWRAKPQPNASEDPYSDPARTTGAWGTIGSGHVLINLADTPGSWTQGNVLDLELATQVVRIYRFDRGISSGDPIPTKVNHSNFTTIGVGHKLIYLDGDRVLDWEPASGRARVWHYDRTRTNTDPLPTKISEVTWSTIRTGHQLLYVGGDLLIDWDETNGDVFVWRYDRSLTGEGVDPFPELAMQDSWAGEIAAGRVLVYLGGDRVLDWDPATGNERIWNFDRPTMPAAQFQSMLARDVATALTWVVAAQTAIAHYQAGVISGIHDMRWGAIDFALQTHFHAQSHPLGIQAALSAILRTFDLVFERLTTGTGSISQVTKEQAVADLGGLDKYTRAYTWQGISTKLTPAYRPFDTIGNPGLDGAGDKLRAAILIHETVHFVGANPDSAAEWQPAYATLTAEQAITNPSSYATFAHHVTPVPPDLIGQDLRFGLEPWR